MGAPWGTEEEIERRNRILLSVASWAYEMHDDAIMSDARFDALCLTIRPDVRTGNRKLDNFFRKHFDPSTGQWVHKHPDKRGLERAYRRLAAGRRGKDSENGDGR
ncbi:hypothetical protein LO749_20785 [Paracoccus denitrificans]|uniref:DNA ligase LigA-related protein n=1 Tax=Paracoccus denitrificans TaxID=266 RepID=UPI001E2C5EC4|nr:hypothetical protein [Paracoccus denitrificans]UFS66933.1 hypothetical protein LO749_20785 [Paracoccus denitrificans]